MIDLGIGNTDVFQEILKKNIEDEFLETDILSGMPYNKNGPISSVVDIITELHNKFHPGLLTPSSKIVVGNGASQIISCFFHLNNKALINSPYWFRIPILSKMNKSDLITQEDRLNNNPTRLITYPNNPDGQMQIGSDKDDWYDAVYLWPWYFNSNEYESRVDDLVTANKTATVFSLSKMTGHCGVRFGWAVVENEYIYNQICDYMEYESGGLGFDTQIKTEEIMYKVLNSSKWKESLNEVGSILELRKKELMQICRKLGWKYDGNAGMFAWLTTEDNNIFYNLNEMGIKTTPGSKCGGRSCQIRLNLAVTTDVWTVFVDHFK